jgi:chromosome segregation ATPase
MHASLRYAVAIALVCFGLGGCSKVYYAGLEKVGIPKRDLLQRRVEKAQDAQTETKDQFASALDRFRATVKVDAGELGERYDALHSELDRCASRTEALRERIAEVEDVAEALFDEWQDELAQYRSADLRAASARRLEATRARYKPMVAAMKRAHHRVEPVLAAMRDIVLALKHQLNAKAIGSIRSELTSVEREVDALINAMNIAIEQAGQFLKRLDEEARGLHRGRVAACDAKLYAEKVEATVGEV